MCSGLALFCCVDGGRVLYGRERRGQCHVEAGIGCRTSPANRFAAGTISGGIPGIQWFD